MDTDTWNFMFGGCVVPLWNFAGRSVMRFNETTLLLGEEIVFLSAFHFTHSLFFRTP